MKRPPKAGKGSSTKAWLAYAASIGHELPPDSTRAEIIEAVEAGPPHGLQRRALEEQVEAMALGKEHRALVESCRALADRVDYLGSIEAFDDKAWREYRLALKALTEAVTDDSSSPDSFEKWLSDSRGEVRDTEDAGT